MLGRAGVVSGWAVPRSVLDTTPGLWGQRAAKRFCGSWDGDTCVPGPRYSSAYSHTLVRIYSFKTWPKYKPLHELLARQFSRALCK